MLQEGGARTALFVLAVVVCSLPWQKPATVVQFSDGIHTHAWRGCEEHFQHWLPKQRPPATDALWQRAADGLL